MKGSLLTLLIFLAICTSSMGRELYHKPDTIFQIVPEDFYGASGNTDASAHFNNSPSHRNGDNGIDFYAAGQISPIGSSVFIYNSEQPVPIYLTADTLQTAGEAFWVDIYIGESLLPVTNLFGVSLDLVYETRYLDFVDSSPGNFFGNDVIFFPRDDSLMGRISLAISRKSGAGGVNGAGVVARVKFISPANLKNCVTVQFTMDSLHAIDANDNPIALTPSSLTVKICPLPDFSIQVVPDTVSVIAGSSASFQVSLFANATFDTLAMLAADLPSGIIDSIVFNPTAIDTSIVSIGLLYSRVNADSGVYMIFIFATTMDLVKVDTLFLHIKPSPDFELLVTRSRQEVFAGDTARYNVHLRAIADFNAPITLSVTGQPPGREPEFAQNPVSPDGSTTLTIFTESATSDQDYPLVVTGEGGGLTHQFNLTLLVKTPLGSILPDPFTPNDDGYNDLVIFNIVGLLENHGVISIYNFRGRLVREISGSNQWDGKNDRGENLPLGPYLYIVKIDGRVKASGTLTLVR